jgi:NAD-dependent SIR2 family protein deacetylase
MLIVCNILCTFFQLLTWQDLSQQAGHPQDQLRALHGSLFDIKCTNCSWIGRGNYDDPFCPALAPASVDVEPGKPFPLLDASQPLDPISPDEIPKCPECKTGLQRPGVVWFGENLDEVMLMGITNWLLKDKVVSQNNTSQFFVC